jgi:hypothetical protein
MASLPNSTYLKALIAAIDGDARVPVEIRNECHRLMQAIDANNATFLAQEQISSTLRTAMYVSVAYAETTTTRAEGGSTRQAAYG